MAPHLLLERNNDLEEFFWPIIFFTKQQILQNHTLPLWNNMIFAGTPLLPDPQSPLFYLPNIIFLIFPIDIGFILSIILHIIIGAIGIYLCSRYIFNFSVNSSLLTALMFVLTPRLAGFIEAGHFGLITSFVWIPYVLLSTYKIVYSQQLRWIIYLSISLAAIFYTHILIFLITLTVTFLIFTYVLWEKREYKLNLGKFFLSLAFTSGLIAVQFLPGLQWSGETTRFLLLNDRDVYPKWIGAKEFLQNILFPWIGGTQNLQSIDSEKWIALGIFPLILATYGFIHLNKFRKVILLIFILFLSLISLNNASPIYPLLIKSDQFVLLRVATRVWFIPTLITIFLCGYAFEILHRRFKRLYTILVLVIFAEITFLSLIYLSKPASIPKYVPDEVYKYIKSDSEHFRVFCTTRCLSQKKAIENGIELLDGYNTLQQKNFYREAWQLMGGYWNYYTLSIPPLGLNKFEKLQPDPVSLGAYNVRYVISEYPLNNESFILEKKFGDYLVYKNKLYLSRSYFFSENQKSLTNAKILIYTPNHIKIETKEKPSLRLVLSEVYSPGWRAYLNGEKQVPVQEKPDALRLINLRSDTQFVDFKYEPDSYNIGKTLSFMTLGLLIIISTVALWKKRF